MFWPFVLFGFLGLFLLIAGAMAIRLCYLELTNPNRGSDSIITFLSILGISVGFFAIILGFFILAKLFWMAGMPAWHMPMWHMRWP